MQMILQLGKYANNEWHYKNPIPVLEDYIKQDCGGWMKINISCLNGDGIVVIDKATIKELTEELLYSLEIYLDKDGSSESVYDFPDEDWQAARKRESQAIVDFCDSGKMLLWLVNQTDESWEIEEKDFPEPSEDNIEVPSGEMIILLASELIQGILYDLEIELLCQLNVKPGKYTFLKRKRELFYKIKSYE